MKLTSVRYLVGNGFKNIWLNKLMSIASIGVLVACMSVIGLAVALSINIDKALDDLEQENVVNVYFDDRNAALYANDGSADKGTYNEITQYMISAMLCCFVQNLKKSKMCHLSDISAVMTPYVRRWSL